MKECMYVCVCCVAMQVVKRLAGYEIQKQELLRELVYTERTHLKKLMIMKHVSQVMRMDFMCNCTKVFEHLPWKCVCVCVCVFIRQNFMEKRKNGRDTMLL